AVPLSREHHGLYGDAQAQFPRGGLSRLRLTPRPEERRRRNVHPFKAAIDPLEMRLDEVANLWAELIDKEGAARADHLGRRLGDCVADTGRQGRKRKSRKDIIRFAESPVFEDLLHVSRRSSHRDKARIVDRAPKI